MRKGDAMKPEPELQTEVFQMVTVLNYTKIPILNIEKKNT